MPATATDLSLGSGSDESLAGDCYRRRSQASRERSHRNSGAVGSGRPMQARGATRPELPSRKEADLSGPPSLQELASYVAQTEANLARLVTSKRVAVQSGFGQKRSFGPFKKAGDSLSQADRPHILLGVYVDVYERRCSYLAQNAPFIWL